MDLFYRFGGWLFWCVWFIQQAVKTIPRVLYADDHFTVSVVPGDDAYRSRDTDGDEDGALSTCIDTNATALADLEHRIVGWEVLLSVALPNIRVSICVFMPSGCVATRCHCVCHFTTIQVITPSKAAEIHCLLVNEQFMILFNPMCSSGGGRDGDEVNGERLWRKT
eukprot:Gb_16913 [translate_table: standard]